MSVEGIFAVANSALTAQSQRMTLIAQNLANVDSVNSPEGGPYQRQIAVFEAQQLGAGAGAAVGVKVAQVVKDNAPGAEIFDPSNPFADEQGLVKEPNVNPVFEMVDLMQASRSYQANLSVIQSANTSAMKTLDLLK
jgi:flagellar basal-body rod protein FlgC